VRTGWNLHVTITTRGVEDRPGVTHDKCQLTSGLLEAIRKRTWGGDAPANTRLNTARNNVHYAHHARTHTRNHKIQWYTLKSFEGKLTDCGSDEDCRSEYCQELQYAPCHLGTVRKVKESERFVRCARERSTSSRTAAPAGMRQQ
jgi:hypothetical protein